MTGAAQRAAGRVLGPHALALPYLVAVTVFLFAPVGILALYSLWRSGFLTVERTLTLETYVGLLTSKSFWAVLLRSVAVGFASSALITVGAFTLCHGIVFRFPRFKNVLFGLIIAASLASFMGRVLAARTLLGDGGLINYVLVWSGVTSGPLSLFSFGYPATIITLTYVWMPTAALILFGSLQDVDRTTLDASHDLGAGRWRTLWEVTIPQAASGLGTAFALMFLVTTADFITPSLVGGTKGALIASGISNAFVSEGNLPRGAAMALLTIVTMILVIALTLVASRVVGRVMPAAVHVLTLRVPGRVAGGVWLSWLSLSRWVTPALLAFQLLPILVMVVFSLNKAPVIGLPITGITTDWYAHIVSTPGFTQSLQNSAIIMGLDVAGSLALGVPLAFAIARGGKGRRALAWLLPFAVAAPIVIPRTVIGVSYYSSTLLFAIPLGIAPTAIAQVMLSAPFVAVVLALRLRTTDPHINEAASDLGAGSWYRTRTVTLPMMVPSIVGVAFVVAAFSMDEILVTTFTIGANSTLPIWMLSQARSGMTPGIDALAVILLLGTLALFALAAVSMLALRLRVRRPAVSRRHPPHVTALSHTV